MSESLPATPQQASPPAAYPQPGPWPRPDVILIWAPEDLVKHVEVDYKLSVRALKNPHSVATLLNLHGTHPQVLGYVSADPLLPGLLEQVEAQVASLWQDASVDLPIVVVLTCIGGFHRSPAVSLLLAAHLDQAGYSVQVRNYFGKRAVHFPLNLNDWARSPEMLLTQSELVLVRGLAFNENLNVASALIPKLREALLAGGD